MTDPAGLLARGVHTRARTTGRGSGTRRPVDERRGWNVLVVQNDPADTELLMRGLRRHGHAVTSAETGVAALRAYGEADWSCSTWNCPIWTASRCAGPSGSSTTPP